jgi:hypothetical protein
MKKLVQTIALSILGVFVALFAFIYFTADLPPRLPTKSSPRKLLITSNGGGEYVKNAPKITLSLYNERIFVGEYVLSIKDGLNTWQPQKYKLPEIKADSVKMLFELGDAYSSSLVFFADDADVFYSSGVLIYWSKYSAERSNGSNEDGMYIYFVSGDKMACYGKEPGSADWEIVTNPPALQKRADKQNPGFIVAYSKWKENEWVYVSAS